MCSFQEFGETVEMESFSGWKNENWSREALQFLKIDSFFASIESKNQGNAFIVIYNRGCKMTGLIAHCPLVRDSSKG